MNPITDSCRLFKPLLEIIYNTIKLVDRQRSVIITSSVNNERKQVYNNIKAQNIGSSLLGLLNRGA